MGKRILDIVASAVGLLLLAPVWLPIATLIRLHDGGPAFYRGLRIGKGGKGFMIFKFRTMAQDSGNRGPSSTSADDPRMTSIGRILRSYKLDELPQLLNVLRGEMSLVGPRPQVPWAVALYSIEERALLSVRPGVTDYASLRFRNEGEFLKGSPDPDREYLEKIAPEKIRLGLVYVHHHNLLIDLKILLGTAGALVGINPGWCMPRGGSARKGVGVLSDAGNKESL